MREKFGESYKDKRHDGELADFWIKDLTALKRELQQADMDEVASNERDNFIRQIEEMNRSLDLNGIVDVQVGKLGPALLKTEIESFLERNAKPKFMSAAAD